MSTFNKLIQSNNIVLIDFTASWCGPCQVLAPILKEVKDELGDSLKVLKIDVDKNQLIATKFQVQGVPTLILYKEGKQVWRQSGLQSKQDLLKIIRSHTD
ncbi:thioredoxin [Sphingobacterium sp. HJSM2_6]|uniref:thioredoxin n=1 Tax=Sphingobacterium sp. HJSM2_6 TaxID=3366264 RepID=UPI003BCCCDAE